MESVDALTSELGTRLRTQRTEAGRTLADVAGMSDVSVSYLAAIEAGRNVPSLGVLSRVTHALGLSMNEVLRGSDRTRMAHGHIDHSEVGVFDISHPDLRLKVKLLVADPGQSGVCDFIEPASPVVVYMLKGRLAVTLDGDRHELIEGGSLHGTQADALSWEAGDEGRVVGLWATVPKPVADSA
jgi:transcriptional regulator with XRE-family HTH domain